MEFLIINWRRTFLMALLATVINLPMVSGASNEAEEKKNIGDVLQQGIQKHTAAQSVNISLGFNMTELFGRTFFVDAYYNYYIRGGRWFIQAGGGGGFFRHELRSDLGQVNDYSGDALVIADILCGLNIGRPVIRPTLTRRFEALFPYFVAGPALIFQGDRFHVGGVAGFGQTIGLKRFGESFRFRYAVRDRFYKPKFDQDVGISHGIHLSLESEWLL